MKNINIFFNFIIISFILALFSSCSYNDSNTIESNKSEISFDEYIKSNTYKDYFNDLNMFEDNNKKGSDNNLLCFSLEKDLLFYISDNDNFLCMKSGGVETVLMERAVSWLQCVNDELYFCLSDNIGSQSLKGYTTRGKIYKLNFNTNELIYVFDKSVNWFRVTKQGILYSLVERTGNNGNINMSSVFYLLDNNGQSYKMNEEDCYSVTYKDNFLKSKWNENEENFEIYLYDPINSEKDILLKDSPFKAVFGYIKNDKYYYFDHLKNFHIIDLLTKEHKEYIMKDYDVLSELYGNELSPLNVADYTVINGDIYFSFLYHNEIYKLSENGNCELFKALKLEKDYYIHYLNSYMDLIYVYSYHDVDIKKPINLDIFEIIELQ